MKAVILDQQYLLVLFSVPFYLASDGARYLDALWAKDLVEHARYLPNLTVASPVSRLPPPENSVCIDAIAELRDIRRVELPQPQSTFSVTDHLRTMRRLWHALSHAEIVHTSVAGWPIPEAWFLLPLLHLRRRFLIIGVESAFWRLAPGESTTLKSRVRARVSESLNRFCIERANLSFFTHPDYLHTLLRKDRARGFVSEATWIDDDQVISLDRLETRIEERGARRVLSLAIAARLTPAKGVVPLIQAVIELQESGMELTLDIYGDGPCRDQCVALISQARAQSSIHLRGSLPYGAQFFDSLGRHDLLVVPNLTDEQPRVVYDAYAQGLPVLAAATSGLTQCVIDGKTGLLFPPRDWEAMKGAIRACSVDRDRIAAMARATVERARATTHRFMHAERSARIAVAFSEWQTTKPLASH